MKYTFTKQGAGICQKCHNNFDSLFSCSFELNQKKRSVALCRDCSLKLKNYFDKMENDKPINKDSKESGCEVVSTTCKISSIETQNDNEGCLNLDSTINKNHIERSEFCPNCGVKASDDEIFCGNCGCSLRLGSHNESIKEKITYKNAVEQNYDCICLNCGAMMSSDENFCGACGYSINKSSKANESCVSTVNAYNTKKIKVNSVKSLRFNFASISSLVTVVLLILCFIERIYNGTFIMVGHNYEPLIFYFVGIVSFLFLTVLCFKKQKNILLSFPLFIYGGLQASLGIYYLLIDIQDYDFNFGDISFALSSLIIIIEGILIIIISNKNNEKQKIHMNNLFYLFGISHLFFYLLAIVFWYNHYEYTDGIFIWMRMLIISFATSITLIILLYWCLNPQYRRNEKFNFKSLINTVTAFLISLAIVLVSELSFICYYRNQLSVYNGKSDFDSVSFGQYDGYNMEWIIVDEKDGYQLLLSKYVIYNSENISYEVTTWKNSSIREWLNNDFYYSSFSNLERKCIITTNLNDTDSCTEDNLFLLSYSDAYDYFSQNERIGIKIPYYNDIDRADWLLRNDNQNFYYVDTEGYVNCSSNIYCSGIRPAMWVELSEKY